MFFRDRTEAGRLLAEKLTAYAGRTDVLVVGLPRGGVPVAFEVARKLRVPLDIFLVRKLGVPGQEELAMGAIASGGVRVLNHDVVGYLGVPASVIDRIADREFRELQRREQLYRGKRVPPEVPGKILIVVDDGLATGSSMRAAVRALRTHHAARIVVAVPVAPPSTCQELQAEADEIVCVSTPEPFDGVGRWYRDFSQVGDEDVRNLLARAQSLHDRQSESPRAGGSR